MVVELSGENLWYTDGMPVVGVAYGREVSRGVFQINCAGLATMGDGQVVPISYTISENTDEDIGVGFELLR